MSGPHYVVNRARLTNLFSKLNVRVLAKQRQFANPGGPTGRLKIMRATVTALLKHERIEVNYTRGDEARGYAERLIGDAIRYGDLHRPTMDMAKFWITDEAAVPKLFKVIAPRYKEWPQGLPFTRMLRAPADIPEDLDYFVERGRANKPEKAVLELRGNPYPPLPGPFAKPHPGAIHNVLLEEARKEYFRTQSKLERQAEQEGATVPIPEEDSCLPEALEVEELGPPPPPGSESEQRPQ